MLLEVSRGIWGFDWKGSAMSETKSDLHANAVV